MAGPKKAAKKVGKKVVTKAAKKPSPGRPGTKGGPAKKGSKKVG